MHLILEDTFFETHMVDVRHTPGVFVVCHYGKKQLSVKVAKIPMVGERKLNLVSMDPKMNEQIVEVVSLEQLQRTHGKAKKDGPPQKHICGVLVRYNEVFTNGLLKNYRQGVEKTWWIHMREVKAI